MKSVIQTLEGDIDNLKHPPNPFDSFASTHTKVIPLIKYQSLELDVIHEQD